MHGMTDANNIMSTPLRELVSGELPVNVGLFGTYFIRGWVGQRNRGDGEEEQVIGLGGFLHCPDKFFLLQETSQFLGTHLNVKSN